MESVTDNQRRRLLVLLIWCLLLTLAWGIWLWQLDASELSFDEAATYVVTHRRLPKIIAYLRKAVREHPPVYYLLINRWMKLAGRSEFSLRFFSVGAGMIALALVGWLARLILREDTNPAERLLFSAIPVVLLVVTPGMAYYAREARMYSLGMVWAVLSASLFFRDWLDVRNWPHRSAVASLLIVHLLALFTHYYLLLPILVQPLVLVLFRRWRSLLVWCVAHTLPALIGGMWLWLSPGLRMTVDSIPLHFALTRPTSFQILRLLGKLLFSPVVSVRFDLLYWILILTVGGILLSLWRHRKVGVWLALSLVLPLTLAYAVPQTPEPRYLLFLIPVVALGLSSLFMTSLALFKPRWIAWSITWGLVIIGVGLLNAGGLHDAIAFEHSDYGRTLKTVQAWARLRDRILFYGPWQWILYQYYKPGRLPPITTLPSQAPPHLNSAEAEPVLEELLAERTRLWVIPSAVDNVDPTHFVWRWLRAHAHKVWDAGSFSLYLPPLPPSAPSKETQITFGDMLLLEHIAWGPKLPREGQPLRLSLYWRALEPLEDDVHLDLKLVDASGHIWTSASAQRKPEESFTSEGLLIPWGTPPGKYSIRLTVTDETTGKALRVGGEEEAELLTITVGQIQTSLHVLVPEQHDRRVYLPIITKRRGEERGEFAHQPVLYGLPNANAATFCAPGENICLDLAGYEPGGERFRQGYPVPLTLHWLAPMKPLPELNVRLRVARRSWWPPLDSHGMVVITHTLPLAPTYPAPQWTPGRLVTLPTTLTLPPDAPTGRTQVTLEVLGSDGTLWQTTEGDSALPLFDIIIEGRPVMRRLPSGLTPVQINFGNEVGLRGYRTTGDPLPGGQIHLTYAWYARTQPTAIYAVFNHLVAADGSMVAQIDSWPQEGRMLSIQWREGEYVKDVYTLNIPPDAPPGPYTLFVGLYNAANGERQPAFLNGQRLPDDQWSVPLFEVQR